MARWLSRARALVKKAVRKRLGSTKPNGKWVCAGGVVFNRRGEITLVKQYGRSGLRWTLPKGKVEDGETVQEAALREVREESGVRARITGYLGAYENKRSVVHYYVMTVSRNDGTHDDETVEVCFAEPARARKLLRSQRDRQVLREALDHVLGIKGSA